MPLLTPTRITSPFGWRKHPVTGQQSFHEGIDLAANFVPVYAWADGEVIKSGHHVNMGRYMVIRHAENVESWYLHLSQTHTLKTVSRKQEIGISGDTGRITGPHLHFGIKHNGKWVDPMIFQQVARNTINSSTGKSYDGIYDYETQKTYIECRAFAEDVGHTVEWENASVFIRINKRIKNALEGVIRQLEQLKSQY